MTPEQQTTRIRTLEAALHQIQRLAHSANAECRQYGRHAPNCLCEIEETAREAVAGATDPLRKAEEQAQGLGTALYRLRLSAQDGHHLEWAIQKAGEALTAAGWIVDAVPAAPVAPGEGGGEC